MAEEILSSFNHKLLLNFTDVLNYFRQYSFSERDKGTKFEALMKKYLLIEPEYKTTIKTVWLWNEFPYRNDFSGKDTGIDLVVQTYDGDYWAVQCKCYAEDNKIDKAGVDSFLATSSKSFMNEDGKTTQFAKRLWISTTNHWNGEAEETIKNQNPPVYRISLTDLQNTNDYINWNELVFGKENNARKAKKSPREHQIEAIDCFHKHFQVADRGKLIMACGTGKTFTSLKIAEKETDSKGTILFLVPSIALLGQSLREWSSQSEHPIYPICICSDATVGKQEDTDDINVVDLAFPACTNIRSIVKQFEIAKKQAKGMIVVFSTYQSIDVISQAQKELNRSIKDTCIFDLIICDEAHRTTGVILKDKTSGNYDEKAFTKVHYNENIMAKKRMYMTATPRLYKEEAKKKAEETDALLCSMDDEAIYGKEVYRIGFGEAVSKNLLSDYKVLVLTLKEEQIPAAFRSIINSGKKDKEITTDDVSKLIGCINALSKRVIEADKEFNDDRAPMRKAVAFCQSIKASKLITGMFNEHKDTYYNSLPQEERELLVGVEAKHIDGTMGASQRDELLTWLKDTPEDSKECHILTNVKCLSEGVDVPSLDAVMFLAAKNSQVDVVQSVGRVMRTAPDKKYGYIIIPVMIPEGIKPEEALDDNKRYAVIWTVLNALRAHDDRFDAEINKINLNQKKGDRIKVVGVGDGEGDGEGSGESGKGSTQLPKQLTLPLAELQELQNVIYAKMVQKVGSKRYWVQWAQDVAQIAQRYIAKINHLIDTDAKSKEVFDKFLKGLRKNINPSVSREEAIQMLSQHLITEPVFEALFENYSFVSNNPVSKSLQKMVDLLEKQAMDEEGERTLHKFYESVKERVRGIDNAEGKQKIIVELYEKFFKTAFPKVVEQLGIVYTPIEIVDFINNSVAQVLKKEFNRNLSDENIHILDPFAGTGTLIARLIQTGLIDKEALPRKYAKELHANEIVLLAYYIASINIENAYHDAIGMENGYKSFDGICLTDTFQLGETDETTNLFDEMLPQNSERVMEQKKLPVRVIIGNPPYSIGQKSANDNAQNQSYPKLDGRIEDTYAKYSNAALNKGLYDSYIKAFRWSSDRIDDKNGGIVAFITNSGWIDANGMDGFRKCFEKEFSSIYVFNLRGAIRGKSRDGALKEGQNVFDIKTGVAITILVKNPKVQTDKATIYYHDIGDYLKRTDKLEILQQFKGVNNSKIEWKVLKPNEHGDWLNQRSDLFGSFIPIEPDKKFNLKSNTTFSLNVIGVATNRDAWVYNYSKKHLEINVHKMIDFYNEQRKDYQIALQKNKSLNVEDFIDTDSKKISWTVNLKKYLESNKNIEYQDDIIEGSYRPFCKQKSYYNKELVERPGLSKQLFPTSEHKNMCIAVSGIGAGKDFSTLIVNQVPCLDMVEKGQCFPLYYYEKNEGNIGTLFDDGKDQYIRRDGITDFILEQCRTRYDHKVSKEDIFYYVYGLLHSNDYRTQFAADLKKMLPRIPLVDIPNDFWAFSQAGRQLAELHLNYETVPAYPDVEVIGEDSGNFHVNKLSFGKKDKEVDKSTIIYNSSIKITNIPLEAYDYVINGKSAIEWIMDRYQIKVDKDSGIKNDPNDWGLEHNNPRYILDLILSVITVSMATNEIVNNLPKLNLKKEV